MARYIIPNVPYIFQGIVPRCHVTSLRMILEFYGVKYAPSYLMNLSGFNYGFKYFKGANMAIACPESPLGPWEFMAYAAEKIGCRVDLVKDKPWDETWELLKSYIAKDIPIYMPLLNMQHLWKTAHPMPHLVVLCGYDEEKGMVMIHDPALGELGEGIQYLPPNGLRQGKSGSYAKYEIEDFKKACDLKETPWDDFGGNGLCVIYPPAGEPSISWAEVIDRNARLTLGQVEEVIRKRVGTNRTSGPDGITEFANDLEEGFGLLSRPAELITILSGLQSMTFMVGSSYKNDAHAFVAGLASVTGSQDLERASYYLRMTGLCYEQGLAEVDSIMRDRSVPQRVLRGRLTRISEVLRRAAEHERKAGESLGKGAKAID
ncbi:MAG: C39 family peptidase [Dehalococcoidia bacterium]|nr:C39 family peptidase [Dehalococcoidia bacterium]